MTTTYVDSNDNTKVSIITQQYIVGLYVAIYVNDRCSEQFSSNKEEIKFHESIRKKLEKN